MYCLQISSWTGKLCISRQSPTRLKPGYIGMTPFIFAYVCKPVLIHHSLDPISLSYAKICHFVVGASTPRVTHHLLYLPLCTQSESRSNITTIAIRTLQSVLFPISQFLTTAEYTPMNISHILFEKQGDTRPELQSLWLLFLKSPHNGPVLSQFHSALAPLDPQ